MSVTYTNISIIDSPLYDIFRKLNSSLIYMKNLTSIDFSDKISLKNEPN